MRGIPRPARSVRAQGNRWIGGAGCRLRIGGGRLTVALAAGLFGLAVQAAVVQAAELESQTVIARVSSALLEAKINPQGHDTRCQAQYVSEEEFNASKWSKAAGLSCSPADLGSATSTQTAMVQLSGLKIATSYLYRFLIESDGAITEGPEEAFSTFGFSEFAFEALDGAKEPFVQAGGHPLMVSVNVAENTTQYKGKASPDGIIKDALTELPAGLVGNPDAMPKCSVRIVEEQRCSAASEVGTITVFHGENKFGPRPLFDTVGPEGVAARIAGEINASTDAFIDASVRSGGDYGVTAGGFNLTELANATSFRIVLWGVPNDEAHNSERWCLEPSGVDYKEGCGPEGEVRPFLSLPSGCDGAPLGVRAAMDSYQAPREDVEASATMPPLTGCENEHFAPEIEAEPTNQAADSPTGLNFSLRVPQNEEPNGLSTPDLRTAVVALPPGMTVNASSAAGLVGCSPKQIGLTTAVGITPIHTTPGPAECPEASKIGTVKVFSPLIDHPLPGAVYLATPYQNPFSSLLAIYIAVHDPISGVVVKLAGHVETGPEGQLTTTFQENPQLPFRDFKLHFFEGARAPLMTPAYCGAFAATSVLNPWSAPESGPPATPEGKLEITSSPSGGACPAIPTAEPNKPDLKAGSRSTQAAAYTPFITHISRGDGSQRIARLSISPPPGLIGKITGIPYCSEAELAAAAAKSGQEEKTSPSCPASTELGIVTAGAGAGPEPFYVEGHVYFAGPYKGAPFSLAIITPALAGPFDLGNVVVRAGIYINPRTAQVTVASDEIPSELKGIPLDIRTINVNLTRQRFTLNPTNCNPMAVTGQSVSTLGQTANLTDRFQVGGCNKLAFTPGFKTTTKAAHTRRFGAYMRVNVTSSAGQANIRSVFVKLPKILAARDETLNQACPEAQFATNPAGCPAGSFVGTATASTPVLPVPLTGPAIFVSHGGAAFPDLDVVLQGDGVTVDLIGNTNIVKNVTSSNFKAVPDVPVSSFQLTLPTGPHSALAANGNLCTKTVTKRVRRKIHGHIVIRKRKITEKRVLTMPTTITGQNGAVIEKNTIIKVEGCPKRGKKG